MTTATTTDLNILLDAGHTYGTIYADPPWRYDNRASRGGAAKHYDGTMTVDEICALPVDRLAAPDAHLYLWVTNAFLFDGLNRVMPAWGFDFVGTSCGRSHTWARGTTSVTPTKRFSSELDQERSRRLTTCQGTCSSIAVVTAPSQNRSAA